MICLTKIVYSIYKHTTPDGLVYIGATAQKPKNRWNNGENYKFVPKFYEAIKRFGWDNIQHEVVCEVSSREEAYIKEKEYIEKYKSFDERYGYNRNKGSRVSVSGGVPVEEALKGIDELLTVTEVAKMFSVSRQTVLKWINNGKIKAVKVVKVYRIPKEEIDRLTQDMRKGDEGK